MKKDLAGKTFILKNSFKELGVFFMGVLHCFVQKNNFILLFQVNCNRILKIYSEKLIKEGDFTLLSKSLEPSKPI